ncbi:MAG: DUF2790 domain-containing protein [Formivibrio sp.]|nr:DUF2790 domain-containing protein [Formivibrio sp.]
MKNLIALAFVGFSAFSMAAMADSANTPAVQQYNYSTHLDIAKVISISAIPDVCEVVPATMTYDDHQGVRHTIGYQVMGTGCDHS